jgi:hypothetical protein
VKRVSDTTTGIPANLQKPLVGPVTIVVCIRFHVGIGRLSRMAIQAMRAVFLRSENQHVSELVDLVGWLIPTRVAEPRPKVFDMP